MAQPLPPFPSKKHRHHLTRATLFMMLSVTGYLGVGWEGEAQSFGFREYRFDAHAKAFMG
jgi:hypothetical protein